MTVEVSVTLHGLDGKGAYPSFYQEVAELDDPRTEVTRIGRSETGPFAFYVFANGGPNGSFVATIDVQNIVSAFCDQWPSWLAKAASTETT